MNEPPRPTKLIAPLALLAGLVDPKTIEMAWQARTKGWAYGVRRKGHNYTFGGRYTSPFEQRLRDVLRARLEAQK